MNDKKADPYITSTPQEEIEICENCPYPWPICGDGGCKHFKKIKSVLLEKRNDRRRLRGKQACGVKV